MGRPKVNFEVKISDLEVALVESLVSRSADAERIVRWLYRQVGAKVNWVSIEAQVKAKEQSNVRPIQSV